MINDWLCKNCGCWDSEHNKIGGWMGYDGLTILFCDSHEVHDCCGYTPMSNLEYLEHLEYKSVKA